MYLCTIAKFYSKNFQVSKKVIERVMLDILDENSTHAYRLQHRFTKAKTYIESILFPAGNVSLMLIDLEFPFRE